MRAEAVVEEVAVIVERERRGVMTHPALQAQWAGPGVDEKRGAGVAQRVTASPWHARSFGGRDHHAVAQIARPQRRAAGADEHQLGFAAIGRESGEPLGEVTTDRDRAPPCLDFGPVS